MMFGEGPILSGNWYNPSTGDSFTVRDTYFEDNNLYVITTDGRRLNYDIISKYVQSDKPLPKQNVEQQHKNTIPVEIANQIITPSTNTNDDSGILEDDMALISGTNQNQQKAITRDQFNINAVKQQIQQENEDTMLIRRILSRGKEPNITCSISWNNFPERQMEMLDMMNVDVDKITDYYINKIDLQVIKDKIKKDIEKYIKNKLEIDEETCNCDTETRNKEKQVKNNKKKK